MSRATIVLEANNDDVLRKLVETKSGLQDLNKAAKEAAGGTDELSEAERLSSIAIAAANLDLHAAISAQAEATASARELGSATVNAFDEMIERSSLLEARVVTLEDATTEAFQDIGKEIERTEQRMGELGDEVDDQSGAFDGFALKLRGIGMSSVVANQALQLLGAGWNQLKGSAEAYFSTTDEGKAHWEALEQQGRAFKGVLFEVLIGTSDTAEAAERLAAMISAVTDIVRGATAVLSPLASLIRGPVTVALDGMAAAARVLTRDTREQTRAVEQLIDANRRLGSGSSTVQEQMLDALMGTQATNDAHAALVSVAEEAADALLGTAESAFVLVDAYGKVQNAQRELPMQNAMVAAAYADLRERLIDTIIAGDDLTGSVRVSDAQMSAFGGTTERVVIQVEDLDAKLRDLSSTVGSGGLFSFFEQIEVLQSFLESDSGGDDDTTTTRRIRRTGEEAEQTKEELGKLYDQHLAEIRAAVQSERARKQAAELAEQMADRAATMADREAARQAASASAYEQATKRKQLAMEEFQRLQEEAEARDIATAAARDARQANGVNALLQLGQAHGQLMTEIVAGNVKGGKAVKAFFGEMLVAAGTAGLAQAAMMALQPQFMGLAIGLGIASGAAIAIGKSMGAKSVAGSQGTQTPSAAPTVINNTSNTLISNIGRVGSYEAFLQSLDEDLLQLQRRGSRAAP